MFNDVNQCTILGNITNDVELRYTAGGTAVTSFSVATNRRYKKDDNWVDEPNFHNVVVWGKQAETLARFAKKGTRIYIQGRMQTRSWDGDDGKKNYRTELVANDISLLSRYNQGDDVPAAAKSAGGNGGGNEEEISPEDLPF